MVNLLAFILGLFIIAALFRIDFFFYMLYIFFGVYFLSRVWIDQALRHIECRREYTDRAFLGERHVVKLRVRNRGLLPLGWVRVHERLPIQLKAPNFYQSVLSLLPKEETTLTYEVDCRRRGYYELGPLSVSSGDMFGIRTLERSLPNVDSLLVYPQIVPLTRLGLPAQTPFGAIPTKEHIYEDPSRMVGVRAYQSGDSLRHIHWKTSAALGSLQVKRFEPAISITCQILLNLNRDEYTLHRVEPASELAIVTAASIANHLVEKRQSVGLSCNGRDPFLEQPQPIILPPRKGREQLMHILDVLARVQVESTWPFTDLLQQASLHLTWGGTAILITAHAPNELFEHMVLMQRAGFHVVLVLMDPQSPFPGLRERAKQVGIRAYQVWQESDLNVWRNP